MDKGKPAQTPARGRQSWVLDYGAPRVKRCQGCGKARDTWQARGRDLCGVCMDKEVGKA
jgi:hypothetical protein